jgi:hypothetical protein
MLANNDLQHQKIEKCVTVLNVICSALVNNSDVEFDFLFSGTSLG